MRKTFMYRIYPTRSQETRMLQTLDECRWLYNRLLEQRKNAWEEHEESLSLYSQEATLPKLKEERPALKEVYSQVLQDVAVRIDLAFKAFFRRIKHGEKPGYPRFRGKNRHDSFTYTQVPGGCKLTGCILRLSKIGEVKVALHRPVEGVPKTCTIRRMPTGKWFVTFSCEWEPIPLPESHEEVGIDVGLHQFAALSNGETIENPRFFRQEEKALEKAQRLLSKEEKETPARAQRQKIVARVYERITWRRGNFIHQESRRIVDRFGVIAVENLEVNRMVHNHCLAKSISDAAWTQFTGALAWKAGCAARLFVKVNPAHTSQNCSQCGHRQKMPLSNRVYSCPCCGIELDRDRNAALNILGIGKTMLGVRPLEATPL